MPIGEVWVSLYTLDGQNLSHLSETVDSAGHLRVHHPHLRRLRMWIGADCRIGVWDTVSVFRHLLGSETYYLKDTWGYPPPIDNYCPVLPKIDAENRPLIVGVLKRREVQEWLQQWVDVGLRDIATEALTWNTPLEVGPWEFTVVEPVFMNLGYLYLPPGPPDGTLTLYLRYSPFRSSCGISLIVLEFKRDRGLSWGGPERRLEVKLDQCMYDWPRSN